MWTVVGGQAPGLDQAAADLRYVKIAGDTMTGKLAVHSDFEVNAGGNSPATMCRIYHNTQPMVALYVGWARRPVGSPLVSMVRSRSKPLPLTESNSPSVVSPT